MTKAKEDLGGAQALNVTARRQLWIDPTRALAAQEPDSRLVQLQGRTKDHLVVALVVVRDRRPTWRCHFLSTRSRLHPLSLLALAPSVDSAHTATEPALATSALTRRISSWNNSSARAAASQKPANHFLLLCPLYASQGAILLSSLRLKAPPSPTSQRPACDEGNALFNSGRFDSLYCPLSEDPSS